MSKRFILKGMLFAFLSLSAPSVVASQPAKVLPQHVTVYQNPDRGAAQVSTLDKGASIYSSTRMVRDREGNYWYKVMTPSGTYGYVAANDLSTADIRDGLHNAGISALVDDEDSGSGPWNFLIRAMALGGAQIALTNQFEFSGEGEASICIPLKAHGYLHRLMSLGAVYFPFRDDPVVAGSLVLRIYQNARIEPEFRFRVGQALTSGVLVGGFNFGLNYPFSLYYGIHVSGFLETGSLFAVTGVVPAVHVWGSLGLGLHF